MPPAVVDMVVEAYGIEVPEGLSQAQKAMVIWVHTGGSLIAPG